MGKIIYGLRYLHISTAELRGYLGKFPWTRLPDTHFSHPPGLEKICEFIIHHKSRGEKRPTLRPRPADRFRTRRRAIPRSPRNSSRPGYPLSSLSSERRACRFYLDDKRPAARWLVLGSAVVIKNLPGVSRWNAGAIETFRDVICETRRAFSV